MTSSDAIKSFSVEVPHARSKLDIITYHTLTLSRYSSHPQTLTRAQSCRITEIRGLKSSGRAQHEYLAITLSRSQWNHAKTYYVLFERVPGKQSQSSLPSPDSSRTLPLTRSSSLVSSATFDAEDHVTFCSELPTKDVSWTCSVKFEKHISFYIAINIALAISTEFPVYRSLHENCYFFVRSGHLLNIPIISEEAVEKAREKVYPVFTKKLESYETTLRHKQQQQKVKDDSNRKQAKTKRSKNHPSGLKQELGRHNVAM